MTAIESAEALAEEWLADAYELVASGWCQGSEAETEEGEAVDPASPEARRWSATGALARVFAETRAGEPTALDAFQLANLALTAAVNEIPRKWNDAPGRRQAEVLEALARAVSLVRDPVLFRGRRPRRS